MKTVLAHGCFDVLHIGHIEYLKAAKKLGDRLIVSVTADRYVNKGPGRPHFNEHQRMEMLRSLKFVDEVILSAHPNAVPVIISVRPDYYAKGPDYRDFDKDPTGNIKAEAEAVKAVGGEIVITDTPTHSSSVLINREFTPWTEKQKQVIEEVQALGGMDLIEKTLRDVEKLKVCVAGECIVDVYKFVRPEGLSSKSPTISARSERTEFYGGGAWAIASHLDDFCRRVKQLRSGVTHRKTRFISSETGQRLFELTDINEERNTGPYPEHDTLICADFGHGYWTQDGGEDFPEYSWFALNVQTNSSNYGFNRFTKWGAPNYLVIDKRELQLNYGDRETDLFRLGMRAHQESSYGNPIGLTLGPAGSALFWDEIIFECPAFADRIVDATGAGDAFFAITSVLMRVEAHPTLIGFLGNVFAGLKTKIIGNKESVKKADLLKACRAILA